MKAFTSLTAVLAMLVFVLVNHTHAARSDQELAAHIKFQAKIRTFERQQIKEDGTAPRVPTERQLAIRNEILREIPLGQHTYEVRLSAIFASIKGIEDPRAVFDDCVATQMFSDLAAEFRQADKNWLDLITPPMK